MTNSGNQIEVFQDLKLVGGASNRASLRAALISNTAWPWRHAEEQEKKLAGQDVVAFEREASDALEAAGLVLWACVDGYEVVNIVPRNVGELGRKKYNEILQDFISRIASPAAKLAGYEVQTTTAKQSIDDWLSSDAAQALRSFTGSANKSTGSSHPLDRRRWFTFIINIHQGVKPFDTDRLTRWLVEIEEWPEERARALASEYEFGIDLLEEYDQRRKN